MADQTTVQKCRFYGTTTHFPPEAREIFREAAAHIERLESMAAPVRCLECKKIIERSDDWFRCFDCKSNLCEECTRQHFGVSYSRHHRSMDDQKWVLASAGAALQRLLDEGHTDAAVREAETAILWLNSMEARLPTQIDAEG